MSDNSSVKISVSGYELTPAYGRDYRSRAAVIQDFLGGKDFYIHFEVRAMLGSVEDFAPGTSVLLRYANRTKVVEAFVPEVTS